MKPLRNNSKTPPQDRINLKARKFTLRLGKRTQIMGILNLTPDSFSGDGLYKYGIKKIVEIAHKMAEDGADILDIGGESSRPGAKPVPLDEELKRVVPIVKLLAKKIKVTICVDTYKPEVAEQALDNGASIINDITALSNDNMAKAIKKYDAAIVLMHMRGRPLNMQNNPSYRSLIAEIINYLRKRIKIAVDSGIRPEKIIIDPGIGFGKTTAHNLEIIKRIGEFKTLRHPILVGPSRKSFIGKILGKETGARVFGTAAVVALAINNGADIIRVHDVGAMSDVAKLIDAIKYVK